MGALWKPVLGLRIARFRALSQKGNFQTPNLLVIADYLTDSRACEKKNIGYELIVNGFKLLLRTFPVLPSFDVILPQPSKCFGG